ncbi:hypothetical protein [uncultured Sulfitobacter sp.]|uniref:hypothetical protein n=1 Tax=uncultured Sulfitobacter sp. TaxID=191468 RepID=UPI00262F2688|nr:hypothetical protein [uncultured Sulfitobacter sp.]
MELESVSLKLPRDLLSGAQRVATARDVTVGHLVRQLLKREVDRQLAGGREGDTDARLLAALQALLARDMAEASSWENLQERLKPHGYVLRRQGGGLVLYKTSCGTRVCKGSELGFSYATLVARFGVPMPDHPHTSASVGTMPAGRIDPTRHAMLSGHIAAARSWPDLINRLAVEGMELRPMGAGLGIYITTTGRHLCNSATVGARYKTLVKRYGAAMPGHPHDMSNHLNSALPETGIELIERD